MKIYTIYNRPEDYPDHFVVRVFKLSANAKVVPTSEFKLANTLEEARVIIPAECDLIARDPNDDPSTVESWI